MSKQSPVGWAPVSLSSLQTLSSDWEWVSITVDEYYCGWVLMRVSINEKAVTCELSSTLSLFSPDSELRLSTAFLLQHEDEEDDDESICASADRVSLFISSVYPLMMMCCSSVHPPCKLSLIYTESHPRITQAHRIWSRTSGLQSSVDTAIKHKR